MSLDLGGSLLECWFALSTSVESLRSTGLGVTCLATRVLRTFKVVRPPVDVLGITRLLGLEVYQAPNLGAVLSALEPASRTVWVNNQDDAPRQRFGVAYQLGHYLLHPLTGIYRAETYAWGPQTDIKEKEATEFACHLLMPLWILEPWVVGSKHSTEEFAQMFGVSLGAMRWQLSKLI